MTFLFVNFIFPKHRNMKKTICLLILTFVIHSYVLSQAPISSLSGPRLGATFITGAMADKLKDKYDVFPVISQFGWQFEWRFFSIEDGLTGVVEFVPLVGGVEQGMFLPSISGLIGLRSPGGFEMGVGPNVSLSGVGIVLATGLTVQKGQINWPLNFAIAPSNNGVRFTFIVGFNATDN
jgi:hypothetical protein